jgi:hypothetical protein
MEEHRLRVFENRVLRKIIGPKRDEATGEWRKVHNDEIHDLHSSDIIRVKKKNREVMIGEVCSTYGVDQNCNSS